MLKLRQWTSSSKKDADPAAASVASTTSSSVASTPAESGSPSLSSATGAHVGSILSTTSLSSHHTKNALSLEGSDVQSSAGSVISSQKSPEDAETDPDVLLEREIEKRRTGNARMNGAVEALWSNLSKKKALPFDMSNAQLAAVLAKLKEEEEEEEDGRANGSGTPSGKNKSGGLASALADLLPGGGGKDKDKEKPDSKMVPINALGIAMTSYSELLAASTADTNSALPSASNTLALSSSLGLLGRAYMQIAQLQTTFASDMKSVLLTRIARSHVQLDAYAGARKRADAARSRFDAARSKAQKSKREKRELEDELRIASAAYDDAVSELEMRAEAVLYTSEAEDLSALTDYLHSHLDYLHQSVECLERVKDKWSHVDDRALNRGINAGTLMSSLHSSNIERPRSRTTSLNSNGNNTVRPRKAGNRPGTAGSISAAVTAGAGRFGFPSRARSGAGTPVKGQTENGDDSVDDDRSGSVLSDDEGGDAMSPKKKGSSVSGRTRRKSSGSTTRPAFNRSLSRLGLFGGGKKDDAPSVAESKDSGEGDKAKSSSSPEKEKVDERPGTISRGWSDTFKTKTWKREKDRDTGGFANIEGGAGLHEQRFDEDEERRRADLLSGVSIGGDDAVEKVPRLPKRPTEARRPLSTDSYNAADQSGSGPTNLTAWEMFKQAATGGRKNEHGEFEDNAELERIERRQSSATTDIFQDGSAVASPLGHSPFPSEGIDLNAGLRSPGADDRMLAFNITGLSAHSAGEEAGAGLPPSSPAEVRTSASDSDPPGAGDTIGRSAFRSLSSSHFAPVDQQDTGASGITDHAYDGADGDEDAEEERAVLTLNGASTQKQRYRSGGMLSRMTSGGVGGGGGSGGSVSGVGPNGTITGGRGAMPPPPIPSGSMFLKNRAPPPPPPSRGNK
ncbi:unnamed protein product [Tilletia controversa]|nr:unnamed protein product [Tilletia controversa]